ncbi:serine/threonine protein phosphatase [Spirochaetia bacterium]|nr:serine/threonine protein phosphatase [Spirochaetia bacterium]
MKVEAGAYSSKGSTRKLNEDSFLIGTEKGGSAIDNQADTKSKISLDIDTPSLFFVADGMGGHSSGDVASSFVVNKMLEYMKGEQTYNGDTLEMMIKAMHNELLNEGKKRGTPNMGTTISGILLQSGECSFFNVGDSRTYRLRGGFLQQLSRDDSLSNIVPDVQKNIITNAIGASLPSITVQTRFSKNIVMSGDIFFICSDGVHGVIDDDTFETMINKNIKPEIISENIVKYAIQNNSDDNCTAIIVKVVE